MPPSTRVPAHSCVTAVTPSYRARKTTFVMDHTFEWRSQLPPAPQEGLPPGPPRGNSFKTHERTSTAEAPRTPEFKEGPSHMRHRPRTQS